MREFLFKWSKKEQIVSVSFDLHLQHVLFVIAVWNVCLTCDFQTNKQCEIILSSRYFSSALEKRGGVNTMVYFCYKMCFSKFFRSHSLWQDRINCDPSYFFIFSSFRANKWMKRFLRLDILKRRHFEIRTNSEKWYK